MKYKRYAVQAVDYEGTHLRHILATSEEDAIDKFKEEHGREILNNFRYDVAEFDEEE